MRKAPWNENEPRFKLRWPFAMKESVRREKWWGQKHFDDYVELSCRLSEIKEKAKEAILNVWPGMGTGADPVAFVMAAYQVQAETIKEMKAALEAKGTDFDAGYAKGVQDAVAIMELVDGVAGAHVFAKLLTKKVEEENGNGSV